MNNIEKTIASWNNRWASDDSEKNFYRWIDSEPNSVRFKIISDYIQPYIGSRNEILSLEVGSGLGVYSYLFAKMLNIKVSLLDSSFNALRIAREIYKKENIEATFIRENIFDFKSDRLYDIVMSFGLCEHFQGEQRLRIFGIHRSLLRPGGILIISVPNILFFPHEIMKIFLCFRKKWRLGYEGSFSRLELKRIIKILNLANWKIMGSSFVSDFKKYTALYRTSSIGSRIFGQKQTKYSSGNSLEYKSMLDNFFGANLILLGIG